MERGAGDEVLPGVVQFRGLQQTPVPRKSNWDQKQPDRYSEGCVEIFMKLKVYYHFIVYCMRYSCLIRIFCLIYWYVKIWIKNLHYFSVEIIRLMHLKDVLVCSWMK